MKTLDKYVAKNFLVGYVIAFCVIIGLRIVIDLFVSLDEFTEHWTDLGAAAVFRNMLTFYGLNSTLYFRDFAGMITAVAAAFSVGKMVRNNEFVALMSSGVSLKRVLAPIIMLSVLLTALLVVDQEFIIPPLGDKLVRDKDAIPGRESYPVRFITDGNGSLIFSRVFEAGTATLRNPTILLRREIPGSAAMETTGWISAKKGVYNPRTKAWDLTEGRLIEKDSLEGVQKVDAYYSDLTPRDIPLRHKSEYKMLMGWADLAALEKYGPKKDLAQLYSQKHFRVVDPIINLAMLMVCLPILVCRDPKSMKSAVVISFGLTALCLITTFVCKMLATEAALGRIEFWAWLPVFIFLPVAVIELDAMKT
ncbi:MAG TPA: LptF/LptG family permease [Sedimentisphaerales bacterium]|nr:LptF/LptG family permease [Sedimentisphaerales bacterium]